MKQLSPGKSPGSDGISFVRTLTKLFQNLWDRGEVPQEYKYDSILHQYKHQGNKQCCDNHRFVSLMSTGGKIFAKVLPDRIVFHLVDTVYSGSQCSFRACRGTIDKIFKRMLESRTRTGILFLLIRPKPLIQLIVICPLERSA